MIGDVLQDMMQHRECRECGCLLPTEDPTRPLLPIPYLAASVYATGKDGEMVVDHSWFGKATITNRVNDGDMVRLPNGRCAIFKKSD